MLEKTKKLTASIKQKGIDKSFMEKVNDRVKASGIKVMGNPYAPFSCIPSIFDDNDMEFLNRNTKVLHSIISKMTREYIENPEYRKIFGFSKDMEKLILLPCNYDELFPVMRYDIFINLETGDFSLCEINTDGSSGFDTDCKIANAIIESYEEAKGLYDFPSGADHFHTAKKLVDSLINIYFSSKNPVANPVFAMVDFEEEVNCGDFETTIDEFRKRGYNARFTDVRNLRLNGEKLIDITDGTEINAIYRRLVTSVVLEKMKACEPLFEAIEKESVVIMGHFRTSLAHSKSSFYAMHHPKSQHLFDEEEKAFIKSHIPKTFMLKRDEISDELMQKIFDCKDEWILKPVEGFNSTGVICGADQTNEQWKEIIESYLDDKYIIQEYCQRYFSPTLSYEDNEITDRCIMTGVFATGNEVIGFYSRAGANRIIDYGHEGINAPSVHVSG